jgi:hypothetical protein
VRKSSEIIFFRTWRYKSKIYFFNFLSTVVLKVYCFSDFLKQKKMCRVNAARLSIYNTAWGFSEHQINQSKRKRFPKKVCLVPRKWKGAQKLGGCCQTFVKHFLWEYATHFVQFLTDLLFIKFYNEWTRTWPNNRKITSHKKSLWKIDMVKIVKQ